MDGLDLRDLPLVECKASLRKLIPRKPSRVLYLDPINGTALVCVASANPREAHRLYTGIGPRGHEERVGKGPSV